MTVKHVNFSLSDILTLHGVTLLKGTPNVAHSSELFLLQSLLFDLSNYTKPEAQFGGPSSLRKEKRSQRVIYQKLPKRHGFCRKKTPHDAALLPSIEDKQKKRQ
jgi:hypothetical protein